MLVCFRGDMRKLVQLQRRVSIWILPHIIGYKERLTVLELSPIPFYLQLLDILTLSKICNGQYTISPEDKVELRHSPRRESRMIPISRQPRFELSHQDFFHSNIKTPSIPAFYRRHQAYWLETQTSSPFLEPF